MKFELLLLVILVMNFVVSLAVVLKKKPQTDKMMITLLFGTTGVGVLFLLYHITKITSFIDVALVFVLLSSIAAIVFAKRLRYMDTDNG